MIRHRALSTIAIVTLLAAPLAACTSNGENDPPTAETATQEAPTTDPADATPQERIESYFEAADAAAAEGWKDLSYHDKYLTPELAQEIKAIDEQNAETGAVITGEREMSDWTVVEETETTTTIEFCENTSNLKGSKNGEPYDISNEPGKSVAHYELVRESTSEPWLISQKRYYEEGVTCAEHFAA